MAEGHQCQLCAPVHEATHNMQVDRPGRATEHYEVCREHGYYVSDCLADEKLRGKPPAGTNRAELDKLQPAMADPATKVRGQRIREPASLDRGLGLTPERTAPRVIRRPPSGPERER